jgi:dephospho-CoA kinase
MIIGIMGQSGSGKSYISKLISEKYNCHYINADEIAHEMYDSSESLATELISEKIGNEVMEFDSKKYGWVVSRKKLGELVFNDKISMNKLNKIMLTLIEWKIGNEILNKYNINQNLIIDGALLYKTKLIDYCDVILLIKADRKIRLKRLINRGVDKKIANKMVDVVGEDDIKVKNLDEKVMVIIIENNGGKIYINKGLKCLDKIFKK